MDGFRPFEPRPASLLLALASGALLAGALGLQYGADLAPCPLCVWQRYPHAAVVVVGLVGWFWRPRLMLGLAGLLLLGNVGLAGWHFGIEQGWWALPAGCAAGGDATSVEELKALLAEAPPACDQVAFTLLGLSLAAWNAVLCLGLAAYAGIAATPYGERTPLRSAPRSG